MKTNERAGVLLSVQRALLGEVSPALRGVAVGWSQSEIQIIAYVDGPVTDEDRGSMGEVETQVIADYFPERNVNLTLVQLDSPAPMDGLMAWVYRRREP